MHQAVFISHAYHDKTTIEAVCARLEEDGIRAWMAPRDVLPAAINLAGNTGFKRETSPKSYKNVFDPQKAQKPVLMISDLPGSQPNYYK